MGQHRLEESHVTERGLRLLLVDDHPATVRSLVRLLGSTRPALKPEGLTSSTEALAVLEAGRFDILITDIEMPGVDGVELLEFVARHRPGMATIVYSSHRNLRAAELADHVLEKPASRTELLRAVDVASAQARAWLLEQADDASSSAG